MLSQKIKISNLFAIYHRRLIIYRIRHAIQLYTKFSILSWASLCQTCLWLHFAMNDFTKGAYGIA